MKRSISNSFGDPNRGASNRTDDVKAVQGWLNVQLIAHRRSGPLLRITGTMNDETLAAMNDFQRSRGLSQTGTIEPADRAWNALSNFESPRSMNASQAGKDSIKHAEGFTCCVYNDKNHNATIGYGHLLHRGPVNDADLNRWKGGVSRSQAETMFREDVTEAERGVSGHVDVPLTQNQFDALVSLVFNIGSGNFRNSRLRTLLNEGDYKAAAEAFDHEKGDSKRRRNERELFEQL